MGLGILSGLVVGLLFEEQRFGLVEGLFDERCLIVESELEERREERMRERGEDYLCLSSGRARAQ